MSGPKDLYLGGLYEGTTAKENPGGVRYRRGNPKGGLRCERTSALLHSNDRFFAAQPCNWMETRAERLQPPFVANVILLGQLFSAKEQHQYAGTKQNGYGWFRHTMNIPAALRPS